MYPGLIPCIDSCPEGYKIDTQVALPGGYIPVPTITTYRAIRENQNQPLISTCPQMPGIGRCWTTIEIEAFDRLINPDNPEEPPHPSYVIPNPDAGGGAVAGQPPNSCCKVQVRWFGARNHQHRVMMDIGSGMEMTIPPTTTVEVDLLVPWAGNAPNYPHLGPIPVDFQNPNDLPNVTALRGHTFAIGRAVLSPNATRGVVTGTFTQSVYVGQDATPIVDLPIPPGASTAQFYRTDITAPNLPAYTWLFDPALLGALGTIVVGPSTDDHHDVPQNAKLLRIDATQMQVQIVTVVFHLSF